MSTRVWKVQAGKLVSVDSGRLDKESRLED
jgi:hypothetical protein